MISTHLEQLTKAQQPSHQEGMEREGEGKCQWVHIELLVYLHLMMSLMEVVMMGGVRLRIALHRGMHQGLHRETQLLMMQVEVLTKMKHHLRQALQCQRVHMHQQHQLHQQHQRHQPQQHMALRWRHPPASQGVYMSSGCMS